jgi:undecaprenyl-diphosphatase
MRWFICAAVAVSICALSFYFDAPVQNWAEAHDNAALSGAMNVVSRIGDWPAHVGVGLLAAAIAYACRRMRWARVFVVMVLACIVAGLCARVVKIGAGRARPSVQTETEWNGPHLRSKYHAFPSGHTACSTAFFALLAFATRRRSAALLMIPALIGFSRIYIGAHHLSDVVCAAALGFVVAWLLARPPLLPIEDRQSRTEN